MDHSANHCLKIQRSVEPKLLGHASDSVDTLRRQALRQNELRRLRQVTGISEQTLIQRLYRAGFTAQNIEAIHWLPMAMFAWSNRDQAPCGLEAAEFINQFARSTSQTEAVRLFKSWLKVRPDRELCVLWREFTLSCSDSGQSAGVAWTKHVTITVAKKVAKAYGVYSGIDRMDPAERKLPESLSPRYRSA